MTVERPLEIRPPRSFAEAAEAHLDDVFGYLLYLTRDRETAEDLSGSTFEKALTRWDRFDPQRGSARTWLLGIARTTALDWFRAESRRRRREEAAARPEQVDEARSSRALARARDRARGTLGRGARGARAPDRAGARRRRRRTRPRHQPDCGLDPAEPGAQATRGEGEREMTVNEIVDELGAARPRASDALRLQVLTHASVPPTRRPSLGERVRGRRRTMLALPVAAGLAVAAAVAVGITQSSPAPVAREAVSSPSQDTAVRSVGAQPPAALAGPQAGSATSSPRRPPPRSAARSGTRRP